MCDTMHVSQSCAWTNLESSLILPVCSVFLSLPPSSSCCHEHFKTMSTRRISSTPSPSLLRHSCTAPGCIQAAMPEYTWDQAMSTWTTVLRARRCHRARPARSARSDELSRASPILSILHPSCQTSAQPSCQPSHALQHFPSSKLSPLPRRCVTTSRPTLSKAA